MGMLEFYDEGGRLLMDSDMITHFCRVSGSGTTSSPFSPTSSSKALVPIAGYTQPVVAIVMAGGYAAALDRPTTVSGVANANFATNAPVGTSYTYYVFDYAPAIPTPTGMVRTWAEDGTLTFDSGYWAMKGIGFISQYIGADPEEVTVAGRSLAVCCGSPGGHYFIEYAECWPPGEERDPGRPLEGCPAVYTRIDSKLYGGKITNSGQTLTSVQVSYSDTEGYIGDGDAYFAFLEDGNGWSASCKTMIVDVTGIPLNTTFF